MKSFRITSIVLAVGMFCFGFGLPTTFAAGGKMPQQLTIVGGVSGGNDYVKAVGLAKILGDNSVKTNVETGGAIANVIQASRGEAQLSISFDFVPPLARAGKKPFPADTHCQYHTADPPGVCSGVFHHSGDT